MNNTINAILWRQFGASIDMLENAIAMCPPEVWNTSSKFWYNAYHCLFFLDYYLTLKPVGFSPPSPFTLSEFDPSGAMPDRVYRKEELLTYLHTNRNKCRELLAGLTDEVAASLWTNESGTMSYPVLEILL